MSVPTLWMDPQTNTAILVSDAFANVLAPEVYAEIDEVKCAYDLMSDSIQFTIKRKRDGMLVIMPIEREKLTKVDQASYALQHDPDMLARLILFLA